MFVGESPVDRVFHIETGRSRSQRQRRQVLFRLRLQRFGLFGRASQTHDQDAGGQRIERAGMSDLDLAMSQPAHYYLNFSDDVRRGPPKGFVDRKHIPFGKGQIGRKRLFQNEFF